METQPPLKKTLESAAKAQGVERASFWRLREDDGAKIVSDKMYAVLLKREGEGWSVECLYGAAKGVKASSAVKASKVSLAEAEKIFASEESSRRKKGYAPGLAPTARDEVFPLTRSAAKKVPDGVNDGFGKPDLARLYGVGADESMRAAGADCCFATFVAGDRAAVREYAVRADAAIVAGWPGFASSDPDIVASGAMLLWEGPAGSDAASLCAFLLYDSADLAFGILGPIVAAMADGEGRTIVMLASDDDDNDPLQVFQSAMDGDAPVLADPKFRRKAQEAVIRSMSRSARVELVEEDEDFAAAAERWMAGRSVSAG